MQHVSRPEHRLPSFQIHKARCRDERVSALVVGLQTQAICQNERPQNKSQAICQHIPMNDWRNVTDRLLARLTIPLLVPPKRSPIPSTFADSGSSTSFSYSVRKRRCCNFKRAPQAISQNRPIDHKQDCLCTLTERGTISSPVPMLSISETAQRTYFPPVPQRERATCEQKASRK